MKVPPHLKTPCSQDKEVITERETNPGVDLNIMLKTVLKTTCIICTHPPPVSFNAINVPSLEPDLMPINLALLLLENDFRTTPEPAE